MKKLLTILGMTACLSLIPFSNANAAKQEHIAFTVMIMYDGTEIVAQGNLSNAQINAIYDSYEAEH